MTAHRKPDRSQRQSLYVRRKQRSVRQFVGGATIFLLLAGATIFTLTVRNDETPPQPIERTKQTLSVDHSQSPTSEPDVRWQASQYVGSQSCGDCHSDIAESYSAHPMANTLAMVSDSSPIEVLLGDSAEFEALGCRYRVERVGDRMIHTEFMTDANGELVYEQSVDVDYAVGSGVNARTYLIDRGGIMFESPITWYTDIQKWDLSPGYHNNPRQRFNRRIIDGCVQCHSGRVAPLGDGNSDRFEEQPFPELGIGCERCHGPGKQHVDRFTADDWDSDDDSVDSMLIVNPARLDSRSQESVCYQCHMDGQTRILRQGKSFHDFRPGMATEDIWTVFVSQQPFEADGRIPFTSQVEQMHASACFRGSEGRMSCTTCHDPHRSPSREERAAFYRERCNNCHADHGCSVPIEERESPPALNSCIHCHMPIAGASDIVHAAQSDHRVLRNPRNELDVVDRPQQRVAWSIFDESDQRMPEWETQRARALALSDQAAEETDKTLMRQAVMTLEAVLARDPKDTEALRKLGFLYGLTGNPAEASRSFDAALQVNPHDEMSLKNSGLMASKTNSLVAGLRSYERYLKLNEWDGTMFGPYAAMLATSGDLHAAVDAVERGLQLDPTQRELRSLAVQLYAKIGDQKMSLYHRAKLQEISKRLDPWDQKRLDRIRKKIQKGLPRDP